MRGGLGPEPDSEPALARGALDWFRGGIFRRGTQKRAKPEERGSVETHSQGKARFWVVGVTGLEPATSSSRTTRASLSQRLIRLWRKLRLKLSDLLFFCQNPIYKIFHG